VTVIAEAHNQFYLQQSSEVWENQSSMTNGECHYILSIFGWFN